MAQPLVSLNSANARGAFQARSGSGKQPYWARCRENFRRFLKREPRPAVKDHDFSLVHGQLLKTFLQCQRSDPVSALVNQPALSGGQGCFAAAVTQSIERFVFYSAIEIGQRRIRQSKIVAKRPQENTLQYPRPSRSRTAGNRRKRPAPDRAARKSAGPRPRSDGVWAKNHPVRIACTYKTLRRRKFVFPQSLPFSRLRAYFR
jgi:hypothetical protein